MHLINFRQLLTLYTQTGDSISKGQCYNRWDWPITTLEFMMRQSGPIIMPCRLADESE